MRVVNGYLVAFGWGVRVNDEPWWNGIDGEPPGSDDASRWTRACVPCLSAPRKERLASAWNEPMRPYFVRVWGIRADSRCEATRAGHMSVPTLPNPSWRHEWLTGGPESTTCLQAGCPSGSILVRPYESGQGERSPGFGVKACFTSARCAAETARASQWLLRRRCERLFRTWYAVNLSASRRSCYSA